MEKKLLCIVMDFADGGDLYTKIANQKKMGRGK
jgi:NIMA (never in mitosis gene a)-related kinase